MPPTSSGPHEPARTGPSTIDSGQPGSTVQPADHTSHSIDTSTPDHTPPATEPAPDEPGGALSGILSAHNAYRARHCAPPMSWNEELASVAQAFADQLRDADCSFEHSNNHYGENLAMFGPAGSGDPAQVVGGWYGEVANYDFDNGGFSMSTGHFTQVVWKASTQLGCGVSYCGQDWEIWVCNYGPAGNVRGYYDTNVLPDDCR